MTSRECVLTALKGGHPEWVPTFEWLIDHRLREALYPLFTKHDQRIAFHGISKTDAELDFIERTGLDAVVVYADEHPETDGKIEYVDEWGLTVRRTTEEYPVVISHRFDSRDDLKQFVPPDPCAGWHFRSLKKTVNRFGNEKAIVFRLRDAYSLPRYLLGMENLMISMVTDPGFVAEVIDMTVSYYIKMADIASGLGVDVFWSSDDYCDNRGPVMGPELWRSLCLPGLKKLISHVKSLGKPFIKHCDGNINPIIGDLVDAGIDCVDPIDVGAGVSLADIKTRFGHRVAIKGGVPLELLCNGTADDVKKSVVYCLETGGPEDYILSSSSDITASVKPENYTAMLETWREMKKGGIL